MENDWTSAAVALAAFGGSAALTAVARRTLQRRAILDHPGKRSSHRIPVPRGAGLAVVPALVASWIVLAAIGAAPAATIAVAALALLLMAFSFYDDLRGLPVAARLAGQIAAVVAALWLLPQAPVFQGWLPFWLDRVTAALFWVWFINLYNFMDGIDGITGIETLCIALGIAAVVGFGNAPLSLAAAAVMLGFLPFNWHPAKIFLGDSGSVPLGFVVGWLLLRLAGAGLWAPALILPLYYLADATLTLLLRFARGERVWQAHRTHFYQRAVRGGNHAAVTLLVLAGDLGLIALAWFAVFAPLPALALAAAWTAGLILLFAWRGRAG
jgi:UDP-N-acetylmuramyl pentapeptide phosphotransferase/UDP-N-acetylglucosamine-1-phosphate transferase